MNPTVEKMAWVGKLIIGLTVFLLTLQINLLLIKSPSEGLLDFGSFVAAGRFAANGQNPYSTDSTLVFQVISKESGTRVTSPNLNPPVSVIFFEGLSRANPLKLFTAWRIISFILFALSIYVLISHYPESLSLLRIAWAFSLAGLWHTIHLGQIYPVILLGIVWGWVLMEKGNYRLAGILLGAIIAIKPNFAFWVLLIGLIGYWQIFLWSGLTAVIISVLPLLIYGPPIYSQWLQALADYPSAGLLIAGNSSISSLLARLGMTPLGTIISIFLACYTLHFAYQTKPSLKTTNTLGMVVSLLISPFSWAGYFTLLVPIFFAERKWPWPYWLAGFVFIIPYLIIYALSLVSSVSNVVFGWTYGWGLLIILTYIFTQRKTSQANII